MDETAAVSRNGRPWRLTGCMTCQSLLVPAIAALFFGAAGNAFAQAQAPAPLARGDAAGLVGWMNVDKSGLGDQGRNDWYNRGFYGGGVAGWYWTDHHKTEIEVGASTSVDFWVYRSIAADGNFPAFGGSQFTFSTRRVAIGQQYQFLRNAWFHPHAGAGVDLTWETTTERAEPVIVYSTSPPGQPRQLRPGMVIGPNTALIVRPFGEVGFKAYVSPRGFLRSDLRLLVRGGIDEVQVRFGFGIDF
jgi:hypothetical protein